MENNEALSIYEQSAGKGFENMGAEQLSTPMLKIAQPISSILTEDGSLVHAGDWYNSVTGESYGPAIQVIPVYFNTVWLEWKPNMGGLVGRHKPYSIKTIGSPFTGLRTPDGNTIQESWCYLVLVRGHEADGVMLLSCTSTNIRHCKVWNGLLAATRLPSGSHAPLFSSYWTLESKKNKNDKGTFFVMGEGKTTAITKSDWVPAEIYTNDVQPILEQASRMFDQLNVSDNNTSVVASIEDNNKY